MLDQNILQDKYYELRSIYKYHIDSYNALYQLKTKNEEALNSIYKMIKTNLIDSKKYLPQTIINDILHIIPYNNRYTKSYLALVKRIIEDYNLNDDVNIRIKVGDISRDFKEMKLEDLDIHKEYTIYRIIMEDDKKGFISFIKREEFDKEQKLISKSYPHSYEGYSLLELCCYHGSIDCFRILNKKSKITQTCLQLSFLGGNAEIISECLKYQRPDIKCMQNAIISHNIDFVAFLLNEFGIEINLYDCYIHKNIESFLVYFYQTNDFKNCFILSPVFNIPSLCNFFLSQGANVNEKYENGETALHYAARYNSRETAELLLSHGANIDEKDENGKTALHYATENNMKETAELLLSHGANVNEKDEIGYTALHYATHNNMEKTAELLLLHGADVNAKDNFGDTALHFATYKYRKEIVKLLLSYGANVNEKNESGKTALHRATEYNRKEIAEVLLSHGANVNEKDNNGITALHHATKNNMKETAQLLLSYGANVNEKDEGGFTALHCAAEYNRKEIAELLLLHGANVNEKDESGYTSLHYAARNNSKELVELLLSNAANVNEKNNIGKTSLHIAARNNLKEIVELLLSHGANVNEKDESGYTSLH